MKNRTPFPFALLFALLFIGAGWGYLISSETPRGQITGSAVLLDAKNKPLADCDIYLSPAALADESETDALPSNNAADKAADVRERRHVKTGKDGRFFLRNVPAGNYQISASAKWHSAEAQAVRVSEGGAASATLSLARTEPDLSVGDHQAAFASREAPFLPVRGYASSPDGDKNDAKNLLHVKIWRTRLGDVLKRADAAADLDKLNHSYDGKEATLTPALLKPNSADAPAPVLVADKQLPIDGTDREGFFASHFPLEEAQAKPGLYLVKFSYRNYSASSYVLVTNLALVVKKSPDKKVVVYASDLMDGTPVANARVVLLKQSATLASDITGVTGVANLSAPARAASGDAENETPTLVMATVGEDEAVVSGSSYYESGDGAKRYVVQGLTDRTVYRPGDTVSYKCVVRSRNSDDTGTQTYTVPANVPAQIEMRDANGGLVARQSKITNASGAVWGTINVSPEAGTGTYTLTTTLNGEAHDSGVVIAAYHKPEFSVSITPEKSRYLRGETVQMKIKATYYFGGPVAGGEVHYYVYRDADWASEYGETDTGDDYGDDYGDEASSYRSRSYAAYFGEGMGDGTIKLDENGEAVVPVRTDVRHIKHEGEAEGETDEEAKASENEAIPQVETYTLTAEVQDAAKRSVEADGAASVASGNITLQVSPEGFVATPEKPMNVFVTVRDGATKKVKTNAPVTLLAVYDVWNAQKRETKEVRLSKPQTVQTGADGRAIFAVIPPRSGEIRLIATAEDDNKRVVKAEGSLWAASNSGDDLNTDYGDLSLLTDKRNYLPGDTAKILVNTSRTGQSILLSVEGETVYQTQVLPANKKSTVVYLPIKAEWGPNVTLAANYVKNKKFASSQTPLRVSLPAQNLTVTVKPDPPARAKQVFAR